MSVPTPDSNDVPNEPDCAVPGDRAMWEERAARIDAGASPGYIVDSCATLLRRELDIMEAHTLRHLTTKTELGPVNLEAVAFGTASLLLAGKLRFADLPPVAPARFYDAANRYLVELGDEHAAREVFAPLVVRFLPAGTGPMDIIAMCFVEPSKSVWATEMRHAMCVVSAWLMERLGVTFAADMLPATYASPGGPDADPNADDDGPGTPDDAQ